MSNAKKFGLNIEQILEDWELYEAIRDIVFNSIDEEIWTNTETIIIIHWWVFDLRKINKCCWWCLKLLVCNCLRAAVGIWTPPPGSISPKLRGEAFVRPVRCQTPRKVLLSSTLQRPHILWKNHINLIMFLIIDVFYNE